MAFRRRRRGGGSDDPALDEGTEVAGDVEDAGPVDDDAPGPRVATGGPYDVSQMPADGLARLDLGALRVPVVEALEIRLQVNEQGEVVEAVLDHGPSSMQLVAFAAPRTAGIWDEVSEEIAVSVRAAGGSLTRDTGAWGNELVAQVPTDVPGQLAPARFVGVDGPRWFLRALLTGPAVDQAGAAEPLLGALREVVVVRGSEAMPIRDPLPLRLPQEAMTAVGAAAAEAAEADVRGESDPDGDEDPLRPFERGPEITEVR